MVSHSCLLVLLLAQCENHYFHDKNGNPIVNTTRFPDLKAFSETLHSMNLTSGWYQVKDRSRQLGWLAHGKSGSPLLNIFSLIADAQNNCWCNEQGHPPHYANDANATAMYLFDAVKGMFYGVSQMRGRHDFVSRV